MADNIVFTASVAQAQAALKSLDGTLQSTGKSIEGVKSTMEKIFAAQAIMASAGRVKDAIDSVTASIEAQTGALQQVIQANQNLASTMGQLEESAKRARGTAASTDETIAKYSPIVNIADKVAGLIGSAQGPVGIAYKVATGYAKGLLQEQEDISDALKREAELAEQLLKKRRDGEAFLEKDRRERASLGKQEAERAKAAEESAKKDEAAMKARIKNEESMQANFYKAQEGQAKAQEGRAQNVEEIWAGIKAEAAAAQSAQVQSMLDALAGTRSGQQSGGAREARRAQSLIQQAAEAEATGNYYDAAQLRDRAGRAEARAADRLDRNEARSLRQQAMDERRATGRGGDISGSLERAKDLEERARKLEEPGSTKRTAAGGGKNTTDVWNVLNDIKNTLPAKSS